MKTLVPKIKQVVPNVKMIHYLSDSPTSQYRNANIFNIISLHEKIFGIPATWQYFESGHGKGPCDGVGGAIKRGADQAVKKGNLIQTARDFYKWGVANEDSAVVYLMVSKEEVKIANEEMSTFGAKTIKGTMTIHRVMPVGSEVYVRETSCFNECCWRNGEFISPNCDGWMKRCTRSTGNESDTAVGPNCHVGSPNIPKEDGSDQVQGEQDNLDDSPTIHTGFVIALYDGEPYVGKVLSYDDDDEEDNIDFMQDAGKAEDTFRWPTPADVLWINRHNIVAAIEEPMPTTSKYTRLYKLSPNDLEAFKLNK